MIKPDSQALNLKPALFRLLYGASIVCLTLLGGCAFQSQDENFPKAPLPASGRQNLVQIMSVFLGPDEKRHAPLPPLPTDRAVKIPAALWETGVPLYLYLDGQEYQVEENSASVSIRPNGKLVAQLDAAIPAKNAALFSCVDGFDIEETENTDEILQSLTSINNNYLVMRDVSVGAIGIAAINKMKALQTLHMYGVNSKFFKQLLPNSALRSLRLRSDPDPDILSVLRNCQQLDTLYIDDTQLSDDMVKAIASMHQLKSLELPNTGLDDNQFKLLMASLKLLKCSVHNTNVTDEGAKHLAGQSDLDVLNLSRCVVGDESMRVIGRLPNLTKIDLCHTDVTDQGVKYLSNCKTINLLGLCNCQVTVKCLRYLASIPHLDTVNMSHTLDVETGRREVEKMLPNCNVEL